MPVYKIKYKSRDNLIERYHFGVDRKILVFFLSLKAELKSNFSKALTISSTDKVNKLACKIWIESENNFTVKKEFLKTWMKYSFLFLVKNCHKIFENEKLLNS